MPAEPTRFYWDAGLFTSYINQEPNRMGTLTQLFDECERSGGAIEIVTSFISITEVAYALTEQQKRALNDEEQTKIETLWLPESPIKLVEVYRHVVEEGRDLIREAMTKKWRLQAADAIHLASAKQKKAVEVFTYDDRLHKFSEIIGMPVREPYTSSPRMDLGV